jgi:hydrogenase maturation protease
LLALEGSESVAADAHAKQRVCIVGLGNPWAGDDAVGSRVVRRLREMTAANDHAREARPVWLKHQHRSPTCVQLFELRHAGPELLDVMADCDLLIVIDAVLSSLGLQPGTIHSAEWRPGMLAARGVERASSHGFGLKAVLELATNLDRLPRRVVIWGIEAGSTEPGAPMSPAVASAVADVTAAVCREVEKVESARNSTDCPQN